MWSRFDICEAYYAYCVQYHSGQWSWGYRKLSQLSRMRFKPSPRLANDLEEALEDNARYIFDNLVAQGRG